MVQDTHMVAMED